jgi:hypothetical protein
MSKMVENLVDERFDGLKPIIDDRDVSKLSVGSHCLVIQSDMDLVDRWSKDHPYLRWCRQLKAVKLLG